MSNEIIKEGDFVEYAGRPNEKFLVYDFSFKTKSLAIHLPEEDVYVSFTEHGFLFKNDTHPIVKKTTPPKKKVLKEFDVDIELINDWDVRTLSNRFTEFVKSNHITYIENAKLTFEVEE